MVYLPLTLPLLIHHLLKNPNVPANYTNKINVSSTRPLDLKVRSPRVDPPYELSECETTGVIKFFALERMYPIEIRNRICPVIACPELDDITRIVNSVRRCDDWDNQNTDHLSCQMSGPDNPMKQKLEALLASTNDYTVYELAYELDLPVNQVLNLLSQNGCYGLLDRFFCHSLTSDQMAQRVSLLQTMQNYISCRPAIWDNFISIDELPIRHDPNARVSDRSTLLAAFHDHEIIAHQLFPTGAINSEQFLMFLQGDLRSAINTRHINSPVLMFDNYRAHTTSMVTNYIASQGWERLESPPFSPDIAPPDYEGFPLLRRGLRGIIFESFNHVYDVLNHAVERFNQHTLGLFDGNRRLPDRINEVIRLHGAYPYQ